MSALNISSIGTPLNKAHEVNMALVAWAKNADTHKV